MKLLATILLSAGLFCLGANHANARNLYWVGGNGDWEVVSNWAQNNIGGSAPSSLPDNNDDVFITADIPTLNAPTTVDALNISGGGLALGTNTLNASSLTISDGSISNGQFVVSGTTSITGGNFSDIDIDTDNFFRLQDATFTTATGLNKTGTGNFGSPGDGMLYQGNMVFTNAGGNVRLGRNGTNTYQGDVTLINNGNGDFRLAENNPTSISGDLTIMNNANGDIDIGMGGGGATVGGDIAITTIGGNLILENVSEGSDNATGITGSGLGQFELSNCIIGSELTIEANTINQISASTLSGSTHSFVANNLTEVNTTTFGTTAINGSTTFEKTGGGGDPWDGGNTFHHEAIFTRSGGTNNNWRLAVNTGNIFEGDVTINNTNNSGSFYFSETDSEFMGDLNLNGGASSAEGPVTFNGSGAQMISGTDGWEIPTLNMDNGNGLTINPSLLISTQLNFNTDGVVTMGSGKVLSFSATNNAILGANASRYIDGAVQKLGRTSVANFTFHVGDGSFYAPFFYTTDNSGGTPQVTVQYIHSAAPGTPSAPLETVSQTEYWTLEVANGPINNTAITLPYGPQSGTIGDIADLQVARSSDGGTNWENLGGSAGGGTITSNDADYSVGSYLVTLASLDQAATPLPVKLIYFSADRKDAEVLVEWATSEEINNDFFQVERSADGLVFLPLGDPVTGVGNTNEVQRYEFLDASPLPGVSYYRLKQVDFDGQFEYSDIVSVEVELTRRAVRLFPNPARGAFQAIWPGVERIEQVRLLSFNGQVMTAATAQIQDNRVEINASDLSAGMYILELRAGNQQIRKKVAIWD